MTDADEARAYRTALRRHINMHKGTGKHNRPATQRERFLRASRIALMECPGLSEDKAWTIEEYIAALVAYRYPGVEV
jgi:hypothetical protein